MRSTAALVLLGFCAVSLVSSARLRYYRETPVQPRVLTDRDLALANVSHVAETTKMNVLTNRLDEAVKTTNDLHEAVNRAEAKGFIKSEDAASIKETADKIEMAVKTGDQKDAVKNVERLQEHLDNIALDHKGDDVARKLQEADERKDKPVLSNPEDARILRTAISDVVYADPLVPADQKEAATEFAYRMIQEGFQKANVTTGQLIRSIESEASKVNMTRAIVEHNAPIDRDYSDYYYPWWYHRHHHGRWWDHHHRWWDHHHHRWREVEPRTERQVVPVGYPGYYDPYYYYGYGYRSCLYWSAGPYCLGRLFGDYAFYHGFHHFFHHGFHGGHGGHGRG